MADSKSENSTRRVAVVGCGVGGLGAAWLSSLSPNTYVTLFESRSQLGGHANTVEVDGLPLDTGFLVYNENTYPNLIGLFEHLRVPTEPSDMSFAVSLSDRSFEWASGGLNALFGVRSNALSPSFREMLSDMMRFNKEAPQFLEQVKEDSSLNSVTMQEYLDEHKFGSNFRNWYLIPQVAAVWSASTHDVMQFPASTFIQFCINHSLVQVLNRPIWRTVSGRSREYVRRIAASLPVGRSTIKLSTPVKSVRRIPADSTTGTPARVLITDHTGDTTEHDDVIFGCHPEEALVMLGTGVTADEKSALDGFQYQQSKAYLHTDATLMPARRRCWAAWNYMGKGRVGLTDDASEPCCVSYWLNRLQNLPSTSREFFVTLNPSPDKIPTGSNLLATFDYGHPQYTLRSIAAQAAIEKLQGLNNTWFCGAYLGYGFHEDGLTSGLRAASKMTGVSPPWWDKTYYSVRPVDTHSTTTSAALIASPKPATPSEIRADIRAKQASGGPYWVDNLGNGGPVGSATREVCALVDSARRNVLPALRSARSQISDTNLTLADGAVFESIAGADVGVGAEGDITGYILESADDVLAAYRRFIGSGKFAGVGDNTNLVGRDGYSDQDDDLSERSSQTGPSNASSEAHEPEQHSTGAGDNISMRTGSTEGRNPGPIRASVLVTSMKLKSFVAKQGATAATSKSNGNTAPSSASALVAFIIDNAKYTGNARTAAALSRALQSKRVFKSRAVGESLAAIFSRSMERNGGKVVIDGVPTVGDLMRQPGLHGGYTGQHTPLQAPGAYTSVFPWIWDSLKQAMLQAMAGPVLSFLSDSIKEGCILLRGPDGVETIFGNPSAVSPLRSRIRVHSWNFFARVAAEADLGLARSFIAGEWTTDDLGALFNVFIANRDSSALSTSSMWTAWIGATVNYLSFAIQMDNSVAGSRKNIHAHYDLSNDLFVSFLDTRTMMYSCAFFPVERRIVKEIDLSTSTSNSSRSPFDASERCSAEQAEQVSQFCVDVPSVSPSQTCTEINDSIVAAGKKVSRKVTKPYVQVPTAASLKKDTVTQGANAPTRVEMVFKGNLEDAQLRKLDHLIARAHVQPTDRVLDLGFGWGGLSIRLAETIGCKVHGITLSKEQHDLALERVKARGLDHLVTFEIVDYRVFAAAHPGEFDKIISIEMIEAVGHNYFGNFMECLDRLLAPNGIIVIQAITMPETRYLEYIRTTDFINTIIFPGGCCPSIASLTDAMMKKTNLILNSVDQFNVHYAETLRRWRANFNAVLDDVVRPLGFDDAFIRTWNYYFVYCEAGFASQTLGLQVLTFSRPNNTSFITAKPSGRLSDPLGAFVNDEETPVLIPAGTF